MSPVEAPVLETLPEAQPATASRSSVTPATQVKSSRFALLSTMYGPNRLLNPYNDEDVNHE